MKKTILLIVVLVLGAVSSQAQTTNISLVTSNSFRNLAPINIKNWGALDDGLSDDVAIANAAAARGEILIPQGTYNVNTNFTLNATNDFVFEFGGRLKPASGVTITIRGGVKAGESQQIFDISAGGRILFQQTLGTGVAKVDKIWAGWWGPDNNNSGTTGDDTKLAAWLQSTASGVATPKWMTEGFYTVNTPLTLSNKWQVFGSGKPTISGSIAANTSVFKVADAADDVIIDGFIVSAYTSGTGTNVFGIEIGQDCDRGIVRNCNFTGKLYGGGIYNSGNSLYWTFRNLFASGLDNSIGNSGNGLLPSVFVKSTNVFSRTTFYDCVVSGCNMGLWLNGGTATNSGNISWIGGGFEGVGSIALATNTILLKNISEFNVQNAHFENNTNVNLIYADGVKSFSSLDTLYSADYGAAIKTTNLINLNNVGLANIRGGRMSNPLQYFVTVAGMSKPAYIWGGYFDAGGYTNISDSAVQAKLNGNILWNWSTNGVSSGTYTPTISATNNIYVTLGTFLYTRIGNIVNVAGNFSCTVTGTGISSAGISLPVTSDLISTDDLAGSGASQNVNLALSDVIPIRVAPSGASDIALMYFNAPSTDGRVGKIQFSYLVQ